MVSVTESIPNVFLEPVMHHETHPQAGKLLTTLMAMSVIIYFVIQLKDQLSSYTTSTLFVPLLVGQTISITLGCAADNCLYSTDSTPLVTEAILVKKGERYSMNLNASATVWSMASSSSTPEAIGVGQGSCLGDFDTIPLAEIQTSTWSFWACYNPYGVVTPPVTTTQSAGVIVNSDGTYTTMDNQHLFLTQYIAINPRRQSPIQKSYSQIQQTSLSPVRGPSMSISANPVSTTALRYGTSYWSDISLQTLRSFLQCPSTWDGAPLNMNQQGISTQINIPTDTNASIFCPIWSAAAFVPYGQEVTITYMSTAGAVFGAASSAGGIWGVLLLLLKLICLKPFRWIFSQIKQTRDRKQLAKQSKNLKILQGNVTPIRHHYTLKSARLDVE